MTINDLIRDEKIQFDIDGEASKISVLSSGKSMSILLMKIYYDLINN